MVLTPAPHGRRQQPASTFFLQASQFSTNSTMFSSSESLWLNLLLLPIISHLAQHHLSLVQCCSWTPKTRDSHFCHMLPNLPFRSMAALLTDESDRKAELGTVKRRRIPGHLQMLKAQQLNNLRGIILATARWGSSGQAEWSRRGHLGFADQVKNEVKITAFPLSSTTEGLLQWGLHKSHLRKDIPHF